MAEERALTRAEKDELADAREAFALADREALDAFLDEAALGLDDEALFHFGVWYGDRIAAITGWVWVYLDLGGGLEAPALVSADRAVALFPLQFAAGAMEREVDPWTPQPHPLTVLLDRLEGGARPKGDPGSYALVEV